jgi:hypothetical protein
MALYAQELRKNNGTSQGHPWSPPAARTFVAQQDLAEGRSSQRSDGAVE